MDLIAIEDLEVRFRVGVPEEERANPQRLLISVELTTDFTIAAHHDDVRGTIDYHAVVRRLEGLGEKRSWRLIESLAVEMAELLLREFHPRAVTVVVKKFILPETRWVSVTVQRMAGGRFGGH
jgi:FolB domain-containing protein